MLSPDDAAVALDELGDLIGDAAQAGLVVLVLHVERGTDMEAAHVDVAEHRVGQTVRVQDGAEVADVSRQVLRRDDRVFDEGDGLARAGGVAEQPDTLLA